MQTPKPIVAIVGSARPKIVDQGREQDARSACVLLGQELAKAGWRIAVYSDVPDFIEADVVSGFVTIAAAEKEQAIFEGAIVCCYPQGLPITFPEMSKHEAFFAFDVDPSSDREGSFYRSLAKVDGILVLGGGYSTLIAGHIVLSRELPVVAVAPFGGKAKTIWQHLSQTTLVGAEEVQAMGKWGAKSAKQCVDSLSAQHERLKARRSARAEEQQRMREKATLWESHVAAKSAHNARAFLAAGFVGLFLILLISGLIAGSPGEIYTTITILGLCSAGGMGATIRMIVPGAPDSRLWLAPLIGTVVGIVFSLLYLLPQLIGGSSFLDPATEVSVATKAQYISAMVVAFLAGLGFDYALEQLLRRARESSETIPTPQSGPD